MSIEITKKKHILKTTGVYHSNYAYICNLLGLNFKCKNIILKSKQKKKIFFSFINKCSDHNFLKLKIIRVIDYYMNLKNHYRGARHKAKKPVRGQRTRTNAQTQRKMNLKNKNENDRQKSNQTFAKKQGTKQNK